MAYSPLDKQTAGCSSPHHWLMSLVMGLLLSVTCRDENGTNGCHLPVFSVDVTFACDFVANVGVLVGVLRSWSASSIGYASKKLRI